MVSCSVCTLFMLSLWAQPCSLLKVGVPNNMLAVDDHFWRLDDIPYCTKDCGDGYVCSQILRRCVPVPMEDTAAWRRVLVEWKPSEVMCTVLIFAAAVLAAASGAGGGGMFVPLLMLFSGMKPDFAGPVSQCMIFFGSTANLSVFLAHRHPSQSQRSKIDYDCVVILEPMLCLGVTLGVLIHQVAPQWLKVSMLCFVLGSSFLRTLEKGYQQRRKEQEQCTIQLQKLDSTQSAMSFQAGSVLHESTDTILEQFVAHLQDALRVVSENGFQVLSISAVWLSMLIASLLGVSTRAPNDGGLWALLAVTTFLIGYTATVGRSVVLRARQQRQMDALKWGPDVVSKRADVMEWVPDGHDLAFFRFPAVALGAGLLGGCLGLGGGIVMSPVLLEVGMHSEAVQATTSVFVFLSSSLATIQYYTAGQVAADYAVWYSAVGVLATCVGQRLCDAYVRKHKRYSMITFSIAGVLLASLVALLFLTAREAIADLTGLDLR